ncbi:hypothetical protein PE36_16480, partial [Moritella sp. PE36]
NRYKDQLSQVTGRGVSVIGVICNYAVQLWHG